MTSKFYRPNQLCVVLGISRTTLWRWVKDGNFPASINLGPNVVGWRAETIDAWIAERETEGDQCAT